MLLFSKVRFFKYLLLSFIFFALDQISKALIKIKFPIGFDGVFTTSEGLYEIPIIEPILMIKRISNKGIAWGIDGDGSFAYILTPITIILTIVIIVLLYRSSNEKYKTRGTYNLFALSLILGGALGNLFDRIFYGEVVDFIGLFQNVFPFIFNLADTFVTIGMTILLFSDLFYKQQLKNEKQQNQSISS